MALSACPVGSAFYAPRIAAVHRNEALALRHREEEVGVAHAQRLREAGAQKGIEGEPRHAFDDAPEQVGVVAVHPLFTRLGHEGERAHAIHRGAEWFGFVGRVPAESRGRPQTSGFVGRPDGWFGAVGDARGVREQVTNRDGALGGHEGHTGIRPHGHRCACERRQVATHGRVQGEPAVFDQHHHGGAGEGFALRGNAKHGIGGHGTPGLAIAPSGSPFVDHGVVAEHQDDGSADLLLRYGRLEE